MAVQATERPILQYSYPVRDIAWPGMPYAGGSADVCGWFALDQEKIH
jgi:hypothetical protein